MITMLGAIAEFERGLLLERQREGVAKASWTGSTKDGSLRRAPRPPRWSD
jgi:DNA invertase Pin-like site-specific DNA recombinase